MSKQGEVYFRSTIPKHEMNITFTGKETKKKLREMLKNVEGVYHTSVILVQCRLMGMEV